MKCVRFNIKYVVFVLLYIYLSIYLEREFKCVAFVFILFYAVFEHFWKVGLSNKAAKIEPL